MYHSEETPAPQKTVKITKPRKCKSYHFIPASRLVVCEKAWKNLRDSKRERLRGLQGEIQHEAHCRYCLLYPCWVTSVHAPAIPWRKWSDAILGSGCLKPGLRAAVGWVYFRDHNHMLPWWLWGTATWGICGQRATVRLARGTQSNLN